MADSNKRKERSGDDRDGKRLKRSKGGHGGKWQTPHQKAKVAARGGAKIEPGDMGIWVTCAKGQEGRATEELKTMFNDCAERFYGIISGPGGCDNDDEVEEEDEEEDIESSIKKELASISEQKKAPKLFSPVHINAPCVLFFKTRPPIDPVDFVHRICKEVVEKPGIRRMKYVNRLTPMTLMGKATESGIEEVGKNVLRKQFRLAGGEIKNVEGDEDKISSYAIRPTIRTHKILQRDAIIKQVASLVDDVHQVNLTKPDKVIIVEIYQTVCGMSVVGDDWEGLKRFNLAELYGGYKTLKPAPEGKGETKPKEAATDEGSREGDAT
ncbi:hypothetical protein B0O99DRAFT_162001 [Bisporella sp. PMI_857]|nr:hypothetical protein B0O99DRAFT_162001 [Bisporella sp. PMI_857]